MEKWVDLKTGKSTGRINRPDSLLRAVETLVERSGVNAIAVVARFPDDDDDDDLDKYRQGKVHFITFMHELLLCILTKGFGFEQGVDVLAGVEAVISHLVVQKFGIPCAHAPAMLPFPVSPRLCPKSAAEEVRTFINSFV